MVSDSKFLDPEVYGKDQVITVAGRIIGTAMEKIGDEQIQFLKLENREIYLWSDYINKPLYYYSPRPYPYYRTLSPYWYW